MKRPVRNIILLLTIGLLDACSISQATVAVSVLESQNIFSEAETKTLASLKQVDDHPLYLMQYYGEYVSRPRSSRPAAREAGPTSRWACSLFTALLDDNHLLHGRNFDWDFSPAVLVFTDPLDGYASVSMVDMPADPSKVNNRPKCISLKMSNPGILPRIPCTLQLKNPGEIAGVMTGSTPV